MASIHELATLTSGGQVTLPESVRQALGVATGDKAAFELRDSEVILTRAEDEHEGPTIGAFLNLLEADVRTGRNVGTLRGTHAGHARQRRPHRDERLSSYSHQATFKELAVVEPIQATSLGLAGLSDEEQALSMGFV